jgi:uncharacterized membrane protein
MSSAVTGTLGWFVVLSTILFTTSVEFVRIFMHVSASCERSEAKKKRKKKRKGSASVASSRAAADVLPGRASYTQFHSQDLAR